jgi:hypothetical protein
MSAAEKLTSVVAAPVHGGSASRARAVDLHADDGISDACRVADPHGVNVARWWTLCDRVLYARNGTSGTPVALAPLSHGSSPRRRVLSQSYRRTRT